MEDVQRPPTGEHPALQGEERFQSIATVNTADQQKEAAAAQAHAAGGDVVRPNTRARRFKAHLRRNRKWYIVGALVVLVVALAIILPVVFAYAIPHMIQTSINENAMPINNPKLAAVSPTQIKLGFSTELENKRPQSVSLDAFPLELYNPADGSNTNTDTIVTVAMPEQQLPGNQIVNVTVAPQTLTIQSLAAMKTFANRVYSAANMTSVGVRGKTRAHLGKLSYAVTVDKVVEMKGLESLSGIKVNSMVPTAPPDDEEDKEEKEHAAAVGDAKPSMATLAGNLTLPNPSQFTLDLGDVHFDVSCQGVQLGKTWVKGLHVVPGAQSLDYAGELNVDDMIDLPNNNTNLKIISNTLDENFRVHFSITGDRSYINGEPIAYLDDVVSMIALDVAPCYEAAQEAIPPSKAEFAYMDFLPLEDPFEYFGMCDASEPLP